VATIVRVGTSAALNGLIDYEEISRSIRKRKAETTQHYLVDERHTGAG